ncbi:MAG TPA: hypothetical protein PK156_01385 [Polyangium sp.]|nr:hypothetical protein [Polyangium sp.]
MKPSSTAVWLVFAGCGGCAAWLDLDGDYVTAPIDAGIDALENACADGAGGNGLSDAGSEYCTQITTACTNSFAQYPSEASCREVAMAFPAGTEGDKEGNSMACRKTYATIAASPFQVNSCMFAGPAGGGRCGSICEGFCDIAVKTCAKQWPNKLECQNTCALFPTNGQGFNTSFITGNSIECRLNHLLLAAQSIDCAANCANTGIESSACTGD